MSAKAPQPKPPAAPPSTPRPIHLYPEKHGAVTRCCGRHLDDFAENDLWTTHEEHVTCGILGRRAHAIEGVKQTKIAEAGFNEGTKNALLNHGFATLGDIVAYDRTYLLNKVVNFGAVRLGETIELLRKYGLTLPRAVAAGHHSLVADTEEGCVRSYFNGDLLVTMPLPQPRWIPVDERLPELSREVLVGGPEGKEVASRYEIIGGNYGWVSSDDATLNTDAFPVTHWMPIPPLPEEP